MKTAASSKPGERICEEMGKGKAKVVSFARSIRNACGKGVDGVHTFISGGKPRRTKNSGSHSMAAGQDHKISEMLRRLPDSTVMAGKPVEERIENGVGREAIGQVPRTGAILPRVMVTPATDPNSPEQMFLSTFE